MPRVVSGLAGVGSVTFAALLFSAAMQAQTEDPAKGAALLAEARKALGGEDKLAAVKRLQVKGDMRRGQGNVTLDGETEVFIELPDKFRRNESLTLGPAGPGIDRVEIMNGTEIFDENNGGGFARGGFGRGDGGGRGGDFGGFGGGRRGGGFAGILGGDPNDPGRGAQSIDPERLREAQRRNRQLEMSRLLLAMLLATDQQVAWIGTAQSPDGTADVLEVKNAEGVTTRLFLESTTHMPLMMTWSLSGQRGGNRGQGRGGVPGQGGQAQASPDAAGRGAATPPPPAASPEGGPAGQGRRGRGAGGGAPETLEMHLSEYKVVNGLKLPHLITRGTNSETSEEWSIKSYRINPNFKADTFKK